MADFQEPERGARYHCVLAFLRHAEDPTPLLCHGQWDGTILTAPQGNGGFRYDPLPYIPSLNCSVAELDPAAESRASHRTVATRELLAALAPYATHTARNPLNTYESAEIYLLLLKR